MKRTTAKIKLRARAFAFPLIAIAFFNVGCEPASLQKTNSAAATANGDASAAEKNTATVENDLQTMKNADFDFVYVFRRKDGGTLDAEDKKYLRSNGGAINRFILTDANRAVIAGSFYKFEPENLKNLRERFAVEDISKPAAQNLNSEDKEAPKKSNERENSND